MKKTFRSAFLSIAALAALASLTTGPAHARTLAEIYAECGLGAVLFNSESSNTGENARAFAIISNVTSDLGTTAILSNASSEQQCAGAPSLTAALLMQVYPAIERDLARGHGEYLDALYGAAGCAAHERETLTVALRGDLAERLDTATDDSRQERASALYDSLATRANALGGSCAI